jgi:hypothetical protein
MRMKSATVGRIGLVPASAKVVPLPKVLPQAVGVVLGVTSLVAAAAGAAPGSNSAAAAAEGNREQGVAAANASEGEMTAVRRRRRWRWRSLTRSLREVAAAIVVLGEGGARGARPAAVEEVLPLLLLHHPLPLDLADTAHELQQRAVQGVSIRAWKAMMGMRVLSSMGCQ